MQDTREEAYGDVEHSAARHSDEATRPLSGSSFGSATSFQEDLDDMDEEGPLTGRQRGSWVPRGERGLFELVPPLIVAHGLPMLPLLGMLPYNFLPAGVAFFIPALCVLTALSACAHVVIVYLAWYLKVGTFEEVFETVAGRWGLHVGRGAITVAAVGVLVSWVETFYPLLEPVVQTYFPKGALQSRVTWTIVPAIMILPILSTRLRRGMSKGPILLTLLLPVVVFVIIGRTVEIQKEADLDAALAKRAFNLAERSSAGAGICTFLALLSPLTSAALTMFASPHINTLSIHAHLDKNKRPGFAFPCIAAALILVLLSIPLALVPYYVLPALPDPLPAATPTTASGVFARLPADDGWVNFARVLMLIISIGSCSMWLLRGRDAILRAMGVDRGERDKAGRWVGLVIWVFIVTIACVSGLVSEKVELLGVMATLAISWFLPSLFFIVTFHVRSPLAIVFPSKHPPTESQLGHARSESTNDPMADVLLARKERQLQKRRLGRRLWQDLIVYLGIMPVGGATLVWAFGAFVGLW